MEVKITDGVTVVDVESLPNANALPVAIVDTNGDQLASIGGGTEYTEGDTDATIVGKAILWEDAADTLKTVSATNPLPVNVITGATSGTQYTEGDIDASITGTAIMMETGGNTLEPVQGTVADGLLVNLGANNDVTVTGSVTANAGTNLNTSALALETTLQSIKTAVELIDDTVSGTELQVDVLTMPTTTVQATDLDIRDLAFATDKVDASGTILGAGTNNIGDVDVLSLPSIPAGTNNIGDVDVLTLPALPTGTNTIGSVKITDGTDVADVLDLTNSNPLVVAIADANGDQITSFGGGTQYNKDDVDATPTGTLAMWYDGGATAVRAVGDSDPMPVTILATGGSSDIATETSLVAVKTSVELIDDIVYTDDTSTHSTGVSKGALFMAAATPTDGSVNANDIGAVAMTTDRKLHVSVQDSIPAGTNNIGDVDVLTLPSIPAGNNNIGDVDVASIAAGTNYIGKVRVTDGTTDSEVVPLAGYNAQAVAIVDGSGNQITSFGGGTEYTEGDVDASITGSAVLMEVAGNTLQPIQGTVADGLLVNLGSNNDVTITSGSVTVTQGTGTNLHTVVDSGSITETNSSAIKTAVELIDDTVVADNTGFTDGTTKLAMAGYIFDETAGTALTENDAAAARIDSKRAVVNVLEDGTTRGLRAGVVDETGTNAVDALATGGGTPHDSVDSGNPVKVGFKAITALPTAVAANDRANGISDVFGRQLVAHIDAGQQIWKSYNDTASRAAGSAQIIWTPASGKKIAITSVTISTYGTTAARMFLFFAANADLTYTAGTDQPVFVGSFAPSTTAKPMVVITPSVPIIANTADYKLLYQNDAALSVDIVVHGYEI